MAGGIVLYCIVWVYPYTHTHTPEVVDVTREDRKVAIYATPGFKATWRKFLEICERDGVSASHLVRVWVEGYVARKDPGNPQRPITAFVEGHEDEIKAAWSSTLKDLIARAEHLGGELRYADVLQVLKDQGLKGRMLVTRADSMCESLKKIGVTIWH